MARTAPPARTVAATIAGTAEPAAALAAVTGPLGEDEGGVVPPFELGPWVEPEPGAVTLKRPE